MQHLKVKILTISPELFPGPLGHSVIGSALKKDLWSLEVINIRDFATDKHKSVDSPPIGGGGGMVMKPDVLGRAIDHVINGIGSEEYAVFYLSPRGKLLNQKKVHELARVKNLVLLCGRFEGIDQRIIDHYKIEEISIGDYVLTGGEIAAYAVIDSCVRLLPGVLGNDVSIKEESLAVGSKYEELLEYPQYTKPNKWKEYDVPEILLSGNHAKIKKWQLDQAEQLTKATRPDLWKKYETGK